MIFWTIIILIALWTLFLWIFTPQTTDDTVTYQEQFITAPSTGLSFKELSKESIKSIILSKTKEFYKEDQVRLVKIAYCESGFREDAINPISQASGVFQFLPSTWQYMKKLTGQFGWEVFNPVHNVEAAVILYSRSGVSPWLASKDCWQP